jgi:hypothetical protein
MTWLTHADVRQDTEAKVAKLSQKIDSRRESASGDYDHAHIYAVVRKSLADGLALKREWFFSSFGTEFVDGDRETVYLTRAPVGPTFAPENVHHWSHWTGQASIRLKEALQDGRFPKTLVYGPPGREAEHETGPLIHYQFVDGELRTFEFRHLDQTFDEATALQLPIPAPEEEGAALWPQGHRRTAGRHPGRSDPQPLRGRLHAPRRSWDREDFGRTSPSSILEPPAEGTLAARSTRFPGHVLFRRHDARGGLEAAPCSLP